MTFERSPDRSDVLVPFAMVPRMPRTAVILLAIHMWFNPGLPVRGEEPTSARRTWSPSASESKPKSEFFPRNVAYTTVTDLQSQPELELAQPEVAPPMAFDQPLLPQWWAELEYRYAWIKGPRVPALVTTSPPGTAQEQAGVLPDATVLFGDSRIDTQGRPGAGVTLGHWLDPDQNDAFVLSWFSLGDGPGTRFSATSTGDPILARPFFNIDSGQEDAELVAYPDLLAGRVDVTNASELHSASAVALLNWLRGPGGRIDWFFGYRYLRFRDSLRITEDLVSTASGGVVQQGTRIVVNDHFLAENDFHGGQFGVAAQFAAQRLQTTWTAGLAVGNLHRELSIDGQTAVTTPGDPTTLRSGGLLALPTNIGSSSSNVVSLIPELRIDGRIPLTRSCDVIVGYSVFYLTEAIRAGNNIDRVVNPTQLGPGGLTGEPRPMRLNDDSSFWVHSLAVGVRLVR
ncbi:MAG: hypothetical protein KatS3mg110_4483 [Pirellulaceae bacterium]|nr:MAG: hypothetical protein KatS3mg110_4483 [Pirellulaceae bacterium]